MRHDAWMATFQPLLARFQNEQTARQRRTAPLTPLLLAVTEIIRAPDFRGCAFANTVAEVGQDLPSIREIAARHKDAVREAIATLLPACPNANPIAWAATVAMDGAIVNAQTGHDAATAALAGLETALNALSKTITA